MILWIDYFDWIVNLIVQTWIFDCPNMDRLDWIVDWIGLATLTTTQSKC